MSDHIGYTRTDKQINNGVSTVNLGMGAVSYNVVPELTPEPPAPKEEVKSSKKTTERE